MGTVHNILLNNGKTSQIKNYIKQTVKDDGTTVDVATIHPNGAANADGAVKFSNINLPSGERIQNIFDKNGNIIETKKYDAQNNIISEKKINIQG